jgi:hypothetical protein
MKMVGFQTASELQRLERERRREISETFSRCQDNLNVLMPVAFGSMTDEEAMRWKQARQSARAAEYEAYCAELQRVADEQARKDAEQRAADAEQCAAAEVAAAVERGTARARAELANRTPTSAQTDTPPQTHISRYLKQIADVYLEEVRLKKHGAIERAAARLKCLDGRKMGRTTLTKRLKEANAAGITTGYPQDR